MAISNKVVKRYIVKRDLKEIFPKEFTGRELIGKFFDYVLNNFFEKSYERYVNGYIGRKTEVLEDGNFYLKERTPERQLYQLTPMVIDTEKDSTEIKDIVDYSTFINTLKLQGCLTNDHNRLLSNEHWSYCPPIDPDMFLNFNCYYWIEEGVKPIYIGKVIDENDLGELVERNSNAVLDIIGKEKYDYKFYDEKGNIQTISFYNGMKIIFKSDDNFEYNEKSFIVEGVGKSIILVNDDEIFNPYQDVKPEYFVMDRGCVDENPWSLRNRWFHIDDIKNASIYNNEDVKLVYTQAKMPIICFNRDMELYNFGDYSRGWVDLITSELKNNVQGRIVDNNVNNGLLELDGKLLGNGAKIIFTNEPIEEDNNVIYELFLIDTVDDKKVVALYPFVNGKDVDGKPIKGECVKVRNSRKMCYHYDGTNWVVSQQKDSINESPLFNLYDLNKTPLNDADIYPDSNFEGNTVFNYKEVTNESATINKELGRRLATNGYGNYIFDNTIFSKKYTYKDYTNRMEIKEISGMKFCKINSTDEFINEWHLSRDKLMQYVLTEITVTDSREFYTYYDEKNLSIEYEKFTLEYEPSESEYKENIFVYLNGKLLEKGDDFGLGTFVIKGKDLYISLKTGLNVNDTVFVKLLLNKVDELKEGYVFDLPLMLTSNVLNESISEIAYNETFDQMESIIENQYGFNGLINSVNNYKDTRKDLSLGTNIIQHSTPIVKSMLLNSKQYTNIRNVMTYNESEYTKFKNKYLTILNQMVENGEYQQYDRNWNRIEPKDIAIKILNRINIGKEGLHPFYNNGVAEQLINLDEDDQNYLKSPYIPATPAYLGLDNVYKPEVLEPNMDLTKKALLCHDGSYEFLSDDYSDDARIFIEEQIYDSVPEEFKKGLPTLIKQKYIPGRFRKTDYSYEDYLKLYSPLFEKWAIDNGFDYEINDTYNEDNPFTWNWSTCYYIDDEGNEILLPGSYRGIYLYFYDTDRPHTHPWEMLGFGSEPEWWEEHYGKAPYTSENIPMWMDIEEGHIVDGINEGYYKEFERKGLVEKYLPVDSEGNLLDPYEAGIAKTKPISLYASNEWKIGDMGHIENVWRHTSEYRYTMQTLLYLMKPVEWIEKTWDTLNIETIFKDTNYEQIINVNSGIRDVQNDIEIHNELINNKYVRKIGSQQWISDFLTSQTIDITDYIGNDLRNSNTRLGYRCAGFYNKESMRVMSDNYGLIPENNYHLKLGEKKLGEVYSYSAILIMKVGKTWMIDGYDYDHPYFDVLVPNKNGKKTPVEIDGRNFTYYNNYTDVVESVRYKTVYKSAQELYNVICGYGKYLESKGFIFNLLDENGEQIDYRSEARKFLLWFDNEGVEDGMILQLNPMSTEVNLKHFGFADCIGQFFNGFWSVQNPLPRPIYNNEMRVYRHNGYVTVKPKDLNNLIACIKITLSEKENILIFDNETIYGDVLYNSLKGTKTERFRLLGIKSNGWNGTYYAPGYIINTEETIEPDYDKLANDFNYVYDSDDIRSFSKMGDEARKTIGYHETNYMENLLIDNRNMFDFYKGMLKEKGTKRAFNKLNRSTHIMSEGSSKLNLDEHWAFNVGHFGYTKDKSAIELFVKAEDINHDPQIITFSSDPNYSSTDESNIYYEWNNEDWLKRNENQDKNCFEYKKYAKKLTSGGFAQLDECNYILDTKENLEENIDNLEIGDKVWVVKDNEYTWNMYKKIDSDENSLLSLKVTSVKDLLAYNTLNLNEGDLIYVEKDTLNNWVARISEDEDSKEMNLYIDDKKGLIKNPNYIIKTTGWSVFSYTGIVPWSYVVSMPNGIISYMNNIIDYYLRINKKLSLNMPDGFDEEGKNKYINHIVSEDIDVSPYIFPEDRISTIYGRFTDIKFTVAPNEDRRTYVYTGSIHLEQGTLPIIIRKDGTEPEIRMSYFSNEIDSRFNGGYYLKSTNSWINTIANDGTDWMEWLDAHNSNRGNMAYSTATAWNWDNGKTVQGHPSVFTDTFTGEISDDGKTIIIKKEGEFFYEIKQYEDIKKSYKHIVIDNEDKVYRIDAFYKQTDNPINPKKDEFWYNSNTNLISRWNGCYWENAHNKLYAWKFNRQIYCTRTDTPEYMEDIYTYDYTTDNLIKSELKVIEYIPKKFAWKYEGNICYTDSESPIAGDKVYGSNRKDSIDIVSSYFDGSDYFYCDVKKYIRSEENDHRATVQVSDTSNRQYYRSEDDDIQHKYFSKLCDINVDEDSLKIVDIKVSNPFILERVEQKQINTGLIKSVILLDNKTSLSLGNLTMFDPLHNVLPEKYIKEVDYITSYDPVNYDNPNAWYENRLGRLWWDTSKVRYIDYYQGDLKYRRDNWGKQLPGSEIAIMEWTRSTILPDDVEKYVTQEVFNSRTNKTDVYYYFWVINPSTIPDYDFRTTSAYDISRKINSPQDEGLLWFAPINLTNRVYDDSSFIIGNFDDVTTSQDFVVQINFSNNSDIGNHEEWLMIVEDSEDNIPDRLWDKMKTSLIGEMKLIESTTVTKPFIGKVDNNNNVYDEDNQYIGKMDKDNYVYDDKGNLLFHIDEIDDDGNIVRKTIPVSIPDESLIESERYGIEIRPRQSMFKNIIKARRNFVDAVNDIMSSRDIRYSFSDNRDVFNMKDESYKYDYTYVFQNHEEMLMNKDKTLVGTYVLVAKDEYYENIWTEWYMNGINDYQLVDYQKYDMGRYSYYIDAFLNDNYTKDTYNKIVSATSSEEELNRLIQKGIPNGYIVRIDDKVTKEWMYLKQYDSKTGTFFTVGIRDGYIQISDALYTYMEKVDNSEFIDGITHNDYVNNEVKKVIEIICDYFYNN